MATIKPLFAKVTDKIYVGNFAAATDKQILSQHNIYIVVSVSGKIDPIKALGIGDPVKDVYYEDRVLPDRGPTVDEHKRYIEALKSVSEALNFYANDVIMVTCYDGRGVCLPAVSYHLRKLKRPITDYITIYMTHEQAIDELEELKLLNDPEYKPRTNYELTKEARIAVRGFSILSYRDLYKHFDDEEEVKPTAKVFNKRR